MLAWPSSSCTARRSPLDCSRWLANEWRSMCGCTGVARPACRLRRRRRCQMDWAVRRVPWRPMNRAPAASSWAATVPRTASQRCRACTAAAPSGTVRRLLPLPCTSTSAASSAIQPRPARRAASLAAASRPTTSPTRRPLPYSSSTMAASRASSQGSVASSSACQSASRTASSTPSALGRGRGCLGARTSCTGLAAMRPSRPSQA